MLTCAHGLSEVEPNHFCFNAVGVAWRIPSSNSNDEKVSAFHLSWAVAFGIRRTSSDRPLGWTAFQKAKEKEWGL